MKEQDKEACNKYLNDQIEKFGEVPTMGDIWQAALEYRDSQNSFEAELGELSEERWADHYFKELELERERSKKLVEALENLCDASIIYGEVNQYDEPNNILEMRLLAERALKEYRGEK